MNKRDYLVCLILLIYELVIFLLFQYQFIFVKEPYYSFLRTIAFEIGLVLFLYYLKKIYKISAIGNSQAVKSPLWWSMPILLVSLSNFPLTSLIRGNAKIIYYDAIFLLVINVFLTAIIEETIFRLMLNAFLKEHLKKDSLILRIVIMAVIFSLCHFLNYFPHLNFAALYQVCYTFLFGVMISYLYERTHNLCLCFITHAVYNFGGLLVLKLGTGNPHDLYYWLILLFFSFFCFIYLLIDYLRLVKKNVN